MEDLPGVFHPWKHGKDPTRNGGEIRGPILGFQITDNSYAQMNRKDARSFLSEDRVLRTSISILFFKP